MGRFVHCNVQYLYFYFVMTLPLVGPLLDNKKNSYSYSYIRIFIKI